MRRSASEIIRELEMRIARLEKQSSNKIKLEVVKYIDNFYDEYYEMIEEDPEMEGVYGEEGDKEIVSSKFVKDFNSLLQSLSYLKREFDSEFEWDGDLRDYLTGRSKNIPKIIAYVEQDYFMESVEVSINSTDRFSKDQLEQITKSLQ